MAAGALVGSAADYLISMMPEVQTVARRCLLIDLTFNLCLCVVELWVVPSWVGRVVAIEWTATIKKITFQDVGVTNTKLSRHRIFPKSCFCVFTLCVHLSRPQCLQLLTRLA